MRIDGELSGIQLSSSTLLVAQLMFEENQRLGRTAKGRNALSVSPKTKGAGENAPRKLSPYHTAFGVDHHAVLEALDIASNKLMVLGLLDRFEVMEILYLLDKDALVFGLHFFPKEQLLRLMRHLPLRWLLLMLLSVMPLQVLMAQLPKRELFNILGDKTIQVPELIKAFEKMDLESLRFLLGELTGRDMSSKTRPEILQNLQYFEKPQLLLAMQSLSQEVLARFVHHFTEKDPELLMHVSKGFVLQVFEKMEMPRLVNAFHALPEHLIIDQFLGYLPDKFLLLVAEQVDDTTLEGFLLSRHTQLLESLAPQDLAA